MRVSNALRKAKIVLFVKDIDNALLIFAKATNLLIAVHRIGSGLILNSFTVHKCIYTLLWMAQRPRRAT